MYVYTRVCMYILMLPFDCLALARGCPAFRSFQTMSLGNTGNYCTVATGRSKDFKVPFRRASEPPGARKCRSGRASGPPGARKRRSGNTLGRLVSENASQAALLSRLVLEKVVCIFAVLLLLFEANGSQNNLT